MDGNGLRRDSDVAAPDASVPQQTAGDKLRRIDADREADSLRRQDRSSIYSDYAPCGINQRSAGIARIERSVRLYDIIDQPAGVRAQGTSQCAHHSSSDGRLKPVRITNCDYQLPHPKLLRITEGSRKVWLVDPNYGEIAGGVVADGGRGHLAAVCESHMDAIRIVNDMAVRENQAVWGENET